ncbi:MAG TPA: DUF2891 domain-containing protein [Caulobacteraceae bacterium]
MSAFTPDMAGRLADIALGHVTREYPYALVHVVDGSDDVATPRALHPIFFGSFDWHSCVHSHWLLARILRLYPDQSRVVRAHFEQAFTPKKVARELAYFNRPTSCGFERPYGWAWLLKLAAELRLMEADRAWSLALQPLTEEVTRRLSAFLPKVDYPVRAGVHSNTAFALTLAHDYAGVVQDDDLATLISAKARAWYGEDADCQAWEPSGDDFLSPALMEAELMRRILSPGDYSAWFAAFLPWAAQGRPATLFTPARVSDRGDGKIAHLDGLNLSRAWCWRGIASTLASDNPVRPLADEAIGRHLDASLPHLGGDYMGEHWLASFALLALSEGSDVA